MCEVVRPKRSSGLVRGLGLGQLGDFVRGQCTSISIIMIVIVDIMFAIINIIIVAIAVIIIIIAITVIIIFMIRSLLS